MSAVEKVHIFFQKNHPAEFSGYGPVWQQVYGLVYLHIYELIEDTVKERGEGK